MKLERVQILGCGFEWCLLNAKSGVEIILKNEMPLQQMSFRQ